MAIEKITNTANLFPKINRQDLDKEVAGSLGSTKPSGAMEHFGSMVSEGVHKVNQSVVEFEKVSQQFANGGSVNVHEMMLKGEQAEMGMRLMLSLRNKIVDAYQDIMRLPV